MCSPKKTVLVQINTLEELRIICAEFRTVYVQGADGTCSPSALRPLYYPKARQQKWEAYMGQDVVRMNEKEFLGSTTFEEDLTAGLLFFEPVAPKPTSPFACGFCGLMTSHVPKGEMCHCD